MTIVPQTAEIFQPQRWGLAETAITDLGERLHSFWSRFRDLLKTKTRDTSSQGHLYLRALLTMETDRNYANIARRILGVDADGQPLQQFMSDSPWAAEPVFYRIQREISHRPELAGGVLILDDSGNKRAGDKSAGAQRQYLGRLGKIDLGQVGVVLSYYCQTWAFLDMELYLPKAWFGEAYRAQREALHIPTDRRFRRKTKIGQEMIIGARDRQVPFAVAVCDSAFGDSHWFRAKLHNKHILYVADIKVHTRVYLEKPVIGIPPTPPGQRLGRRRSRRRVLSAAKPVLVATALPPESWQTLTIRPTERGLLMLPCAVRRVWTVSQEGHWLEEWLLAYKKADGTCHFSLSNAPATTTLEQLATWRSTRYFIERTIEDAKSEIGWDELVARKYRAWMHHAALTALAVWFAAEIKLDWAHDCPRDPALATQLQLSTLPALSTANIRELLQAVLPLPQLSVPQATSLVVKHLVNRTRSTRSRLKRQSLVNPVNWGT